ncbi:exchange factor for Arf 6 isoform X2 [Haematobia irritans]|uniref:exchange factor for Arf 6 isoform X2 n=1 Tax=Haematobia irritans TaxID=7368 RepID=UPI003F5098EF
MTTEELKVVLHRSSDHSGFGFSLLGTTGPPHVIYDIVENSPAADCGVVEAGDVILKVNEIDVHQYTTKEVLKCLRLSEDFVTLELKRDPKLKARIKEQLANTKSPHYIDIETSPTNNYDYQHHHHHHHRQQQNKSSPQHQRYHHHEAANNSSSSTCSNKLQQHYEAATTTTTTHNYMESTTIVHQQSTHSSSPASNSPASSSRFKSPTNLPHRHNQAAVGGSNHSRSSSGSSNKIQLVEGGSSGVGTSGANTATSPTSRIPSRIPQALKCPQKSQQSPQHKRPRPSQIPTKAMMTSSITSATGGGSIGSTTTCDAAAGAATTTTNGNSIGPHSLQHSNSYSGNTTAAASRQNKSNSSDDRDTPEPNSAPPQPAKAPRFEAYMMTGDLILNLSRTPQTSNPLPVHAKKVDSLRDSPNRVGLARANGALAPKASGESSPTSSSSQESPTHTTTNTDSKNLQNKEKSRFHKKQALAQNLQKYQQQDSMETTTYNNRQDSLANDTLLMCEELEKDDEENVDRIGGGGGHQHRHQRHQRYVQQNKQQRYQTPSRQQKSYEYYQNDDEERRQACDEENEDEEEDYDGNYAGEEEEDDDETNYDITNLETYNSGGGGGCGGGGIGGSAAHADDEASDRQCLMQYGDDDDDDVVDDDEMLADDSNSMGSTSNKQKIKAYKQKPPLRYKLRSDDNVDCPRNMRSSASSSSSTTVGGGHGGFGGGGGGGNNTSQDETSFSVPTSPISLSTPLIDKETANSVPTSPEPSNIAAGTGVVVDTSGVVRRHHHHNGQIVRKCDSAGFRTSKSEDHLQQIQREGMAAVIPIDIDEDVNSSLNTLLDTRQDSEDSQNSDRDRIVWTYNAPLQPHQIAALQQQQQQQQQYSSNYHTNNSHNHSHSSSMSSSPQHSVGSPASPTSVSSSVMSSSGGSKGAFGLSGNNNGHMHQQHVVVTNGGMILSDPSDSDSTILVSDAAVQRQHRQHHQQQKSSEHKVVIKVRGADNGNLNNNNGSPTSRSQHGPSSDLKDSEDELATLTEEPLQNATSSTIGMGGSNNNSGDGRDSSPPVSDDGSDVESLHSYHYSPKAVDMPSAIRLAKRLYTLDGFKKSDVSRHLSKNNDFNRAVADEYLKYFNFDTKTLDESLREFLQQFALSGETQERERVLVHFSKRYLDCNPGTFNSQDAVHTLTCAIMLLNTDLHGQNIGRKMTCSEFIENLAELNDGENFPKDILKCLYQAIKTQPLEWALDDDANDLQKQQSDNKNSIQSTAHLGQNPFLDLPETANAVEYKKGYVMRKSCYDANYKKTPFGKRSWKMFYCTLRDLVLFLHKDEHGFRKSQMSDNLHNAIRIHHALATKATDYTKKQHVFRLQTADQAEYLFQTSDSKELQSWVETINFVCAAYSAPPLEGGVGSQKRFQRPLLPSSHTKLLLKEQLESHRQQLGKIEYTVMEHKKGPIPTKGLALQNYKEKEAFLQYELRRYKAYVSILEAKILADQQQQFEMQQSNQLNEEDTDKFFKIQTSTTPIRLQPLPASTANSINANEEQEQQQQPQLSSTQQQQQQQTGNRLYGCFAWLSCILS